jgi:hypothetical protein
MHGVTLKEQLIPDRIFLRPRMMLRKYSLFALLLAAPLAIAQTTTQPAATWVTIASEGQTTAITIPAGTTYRFGDTAHNLWSAPITVTAATTFSPLYYPDNVFPFPDPDSGTTKEFDVLETAAPQTITVANIAVSPATTYAQVVPPLVAPTAVPLQPGTAYTLTFSNFSTPATAGPNALMFAFVNAPANLANNTWEGTQMNLTFDGVTLTCSYGQTYTTGVFTLTCTVPTSTAATATTSGQ